MRISSLSTFVIRIFPFNLFVLLFTDKSRFDKDIDAVMRREREAEKARYAQHIEEKRYHHVVREQEHWHNVQKETQDQRMKWQSRKSKANDPSIPFNFVSGEYIPSPEGRRLQYHDQVNQYREAVRMKELYNRANKFDPCTGESCRRISSPTPPVKPSDV
eukprot:TRINITY_DN3774_c0_g1_i3.p1 TRINITY_DN3774_c0_g1~~TRINITY_DN3774_c0_g1_i3.p1  ORF type:complete len:160 (+),score=30.48 TRINITY_DN3774_c0_g1_i3:435-914(+)